MGKKQQNKKTSKNKIIGWIAGILATVLILGLVVFSFLSDSGFFLRRTTVLSTDDCEVDQAMLTYYTYVAYVNFYNMYYSYLSAFGLSTGVSLKAQTIPNSTTTWFENFENSAVSELSQLMVYAQAAKAEGMTLTEEQVKAIDDEIEAIKASEKESDSTMSSAIGSTTGVPGVNLDDIRRCMELTTLASAYIDKLGDSFTYDDETVAKYYDEHAKEYQTVDYLTYTIAAKLPDQTAENYEEEKAALEAEAKAKADELALCKTEEDFKNWIKSYLTAGGKTEEEIESALTAAVKTGAVYTEGEKFSEWAFGGETKTGDTFKAESGLTVYLLTAAPARDETPSKATVHALTFDTAEAADEALSKFNAGEKTAEAFEKIAEELENPNSKFNITASSTSLDSDVVDWVFSAECEAGTHKLFALEKTWCLVFVDEISDEATWEQAVKSDLLDADMEKAYEELEEKYPVAIDTEAIRKLAI